MAGALLSYEHLGGDLHRHGDGTRQAHAHTGPHAHGHQHAGHDLHGHDHHHGHAEAARLLRPGGRLALADIVSGRPLVGRTRRNTDLWAACIGGAIPRDSYVEAIEEAGLAVEEVRENQYEFLTAHALEACDKYGVVSVSLLARK